MLQVSCEVQSSQNVFADQHLLRRGGATLLKHEACLTNLGSSRRVFALTMLNSLWVQLNFWELACTLLMSLAIWRCWPQQKTLCWSCQINITCFGQLEKICQTIPNNQLSFFRQKAFGEEKKWMRKSRQCCHEGQLASTHQHLSMLNIHARKKERGLTVDCEKDFKKRHKWTMLALDFF